MVWARRVSRSSPPAQGFAPAASPHTPGGCLQILASAGAAKNGPMRDFVWIRGGLIGVLLDSDRNGLMPHLPIRTGGFRKMNKLSYGDRRQSERAPALRRRL